MNEIQQENNGPFSLKKKKIKISSCNVGFHLTLHFYFGFPHLDYFENFRQ